MTGLRIWEVYLPPGLTLININQTRLHHRVKAPLVKALRLAGKQAAVDAQVPALRRAHIFGYLYPKTSGRRDPANWYPSFKAAVDGLVDAGVLPDDDDKHLVGPDMRLGHKVPDAHLMLRIHELPEVAS